MRWEGFSGSLDDAYQRLRAPWLQPPGQHTLRASVVADPQFARNTDNTPAVIVTEIVPGNTLDVTVAAKGGGSENKSKMIANPSDSLVDWVLKDRAATSGAGWCPPGCSASALAARRRKPCCWPSRA